MKVQPQRTLEHETNQYTAHLIAPATGFVRGQGSEQRSYQIRQPESELPAHRHRTQAMGQYGHRLDLQPIHEPADATDAGQLGRHQLRRPIPQRRQSDQESLELHVPEPDQEHRRSGEPDGR